MTRPLLALLPLFLATHLAGQSLVLPGDFPDPSVVQSGDSYWATATTSNWAPAFPLLESSDLIHWELRGHVFTELPSWADYYFWAPEISYDNGKYYVYYSAHKRGGNLCIAVASADKPEGPYTDHGPLMCQEAGSIDAWPMRDKSGKLYMIWKEDGNSRKLPTPIWAMEMSEDRTKLIGEKKELFRNDAAWEANLVEGVSMIRHGDYFYAFYAGAGCCGRGCSYGIGVARAKDLLGPWEKYDQNPLIAAGDDWKCPGHGTPIEKDGKFYFLYHAYDEDTNVYTGRQGVLSEFVFTADGWVEFVNGPGTGNEPIQREIRDEFNGNETAEHWQWSVFTKPKFRQRKGRLELWALPAATGAYLGTKTYAGNYTADVVIDRRASTSNAGLGFVGDDKNMVSATLAGNELVVRKIERDKEVVVERKSIQPSDKLYLRGSVANGKDIFYYVSTDGKNFSPLNGQAVDGFFLPPWDRAIRVALISKGAPRTKAVFENFVLKNE